jgi:hypothetical protein
MIRCMYLMSADGCNIISGIVHLVTVIRFFFNRYFTKMSYTKDQFSYPFVFPGFPAIGFIFQFF